MRACEERHFAGLAPCRALLSSELFTEAQVPAASLKTEKTPLLAKESDFSDSALHCVGALCALSRFAEVWQSLFEKLPKWEVRVLIFHRYYPAWLLSLYGEYQRQWA